MTMVSFRIDERDAGALQEWADRLGLERSALLREALRRHLARLASEVDVAKWESAPLSDSERALEDAAEWGPAEDWSDWRDAAR
jgi:predicted transcriptional regulator